jgi:aminoglycoside N3'-acetyltransferase
MELFKIPSDINNILIHTDILRGLKFPINDKKSFLNSHFNFIKDYSGVNNIYFPSFNYDCLKSGIYNVEEDPIQVGALNEFIRKEKFFNRNKVPVFSFISSSSFENDCYLNGITIDPFGKESLFHNLYLNKSYLLHYGSNFDTSTIIHYVERVSNKLLYRYDKYFDIKVVSDDKKNDIKLKYHVRPMRIILDYDWIRLEKELVKNGLLFTYNSGRTKLMGIKVKDLVDFWIEKLNEDPLYLLNIETRTKIECELDKLGRGFNLNDFE